MIDDSRRDPTFVLNYGPWVLVSGASEGTGAEMALLAAAKGCNVILVARRTEKLHELAAGIQQTYAVQTRVCSLDLTAPDAAAQLQASADGLDLGLVIFNAGGDSVGGPFLAKPYAEWRQLLQRNIDMLTEACHRFATAFVARGRGGIILVGSEAAFQGTGRLALYSATKAYALNLGESLWRELKPKGVDVLNVLIGATDTPKLRSVFAKNNLSPDLVPLTAARDVADAALANLAEGPTIVLSHIDDDDNPLYSRRLRRERIAYQSEFLNNFYGPE
ncbi:SDR family NAD(P)-dependent oxidoreductase [soil metagenome]